MSTFVVFRRELRALFDSPLAYIVAIAFLVLNSGLFVLDFWIADQVSMRGFFDYVSWTACLFIPAITMRSWAEEKKGGTFELLLTFPMRTISLVVGKFLAALVFYLFCLSGSLVIAACLATLATPGLPPDWGAMVAAYVGTILLGAFVIALGMFLSGLFADQIVAYVVTLVVVALLRFAGFVPIALQLDSVIAGLGTFLKDGVSFGTPLGRFARGLVGLGDVLFVLVWTTGFLLLNGVFVEESRMKPGSRTRRILAAALGIPVVILAGSLVIELTPRADLTADKLYTISPAAVEVLKSIPEDDPIRIKLYFSPRDEMPAFMANLERDTVDKLEGYQRASGGRVKVEVFHLHADDAILRATQEMQAQLMGRKDDGQEKKGEVEEKLLQEGVVPFRIRSGGISGSETKVVYAALAVTKGTAKKEIIPQLTPGILAGLEQELVTRAYRLVHEQKPVVGILAPIQAVNIDPQQMQLMAQLGLPVDQLAREQDDYRMTQAIIGQSDQYEVRRLRPDQGQPLPDDLRTLVVIRPENLSPRMKWEIERFLARGGSLVLAVQTYDARLQPTPGGASVQLMPIEAGTDDLLGRYGIAVPKKMVLNDQSFPLTYSMGPFGGQVTVDFRWTFKADAGNFDHGTAITNNVGGFVLVDAAAPVELDKARLADQKLEATPIMSTGAKAWTRDVPTLDVPRDLNDPRPAEGPIVLAALVRGTFAPPDGAPPAWPGASEETQPPPPPPVEPKPGSLLVLGMARPFTDNMIADPQSGAVGWAGVLLKNAVDALSLGEELLRLTAREPVERPIRDVERGTILLYEAIMIGLAPAIILVIGVLRLLARRRRTERSWTPATAGGQP